jgi:hypothetical protein
LLPREDTGRALAKARFTASRLPLVDGVLDIGPGHVVTECWLDAAHDVFLTDHRMGPHPILPAVVALELLAETASLLVPGAPVLLSRVGIETPLKLKPGERIALRCRARRSKGVVEMSLEVDPVGKNGRWLETDRVVVRARAEGSEPQPDDVVALENDTLFRRVAITYPETWSKDPRSRSMYHGAAFRGLSEVSVSTGERHQAEIVAPSSGALRPGRPDNWHVPAAALDNCLQACGVVTRARFGVAALPLGFGRLRVGRPPLAGERCRAWVSLLGRTDDEIRFDLSLIGCDGALLVEIEDYLAKILGEPTRRKSSGLGRRVS